MNWPLALLAVGCLCAAAPPGFWPGAEFLVVPGWLAFYAAIDHPAVRRRHLQAYLVGTVHMLVFSFSVRHVALPAYLGIGLVGGLYYVLAVAWTRALGRWVPGAVAFGIALAGVHWLRAHFLDIQYPHGQPVHCLYEFPALLGSLRWGSEIFSNLLIGVLAAAPVDLYRAWRLGVPGFRRSAVVLAVTVLVAVVTMWSGDLLSGAVPEPDRQVTIAALEPGFAADDFFTGRWVQQFEQRVLAPTRRQLARASADGAAVDLVVWPESISHLGLSPAGRTGSATHPVVRPWRGAELRWPGSTRLLSGSEFVGGPPAKLRKVVAVLTDGAGHYLGHQEKRRLVPGGEHQPFLDWLPFGAGEWVRSWFERAMGQPLPEVTPGVIRPPLKTASGLWFGALTCFDNAFPHVAEEQVLAGASFLVIISNEAWYRGGAELDQMAAMTVCRAIECRLPILRCTVDGATMVVDARGRITGRLVASERRESRFFCRNLAVSSLGHRSVPRLHGVVRWLTLWSLLSLIGPLYRSWGKLLRRGSKAEPRPKADPARAVAGS